ncbi:ABC transporter substrate-binding protein [Nocardia sp. AG03]|uniref:ABC transporter substrate-binding protein n=1 Tax=Nocardia sp. AG03 TaxID=3025312 RepID=UPI0024181CB0|nr:ABC transporter substrate-binding protein [Nocardia sp. AG03]
MRKTIRRIALLAAATSLLAVSCATGDEDNSALTAPLPTTVPPGVSLAVAANTAKVALTASGELGKLPFTVSSWPAVQAGPDVIQAFRGGSVDLATNAGIPPIHAHATGLDAKIVGVKVRTTPLYKLATAPGSNINSVADLRGKKIGFSPGQAQGLVVLRTLKAAGIRTDEVQLVELSSTKFLTALQAKELDVAPLGEPSLTKYLDKYASEGATGVETTAVDALSVLWAPTAVLRDENKAAAVAEFVKFWARGEVWAWEHPDEWIDAYYVKDQSVSVADGKRILTTVEQPYFPENWDEAISWEQETIDLVTSAGFFGKSFDAEELFDRRFEKIAYEAVAAPYRNKGA